MTRFEHDLIDRIHRHKNLLFILVATMLGLFVRFCGRNHLTVDYTFWLEPWYNTLSQGGFAAIRSNTGCDYNVVYQALIVLMSHLPGIALHKYKLLSIAADFFLAWSGGLLAAQWNGGLRSEKGQTAFAGAWSILMLWPSIFLNSAYWAQCDSIYTCLILFSLVFHFREKPLPTFLFLSLAFGMKLQTVLILPFFLYEYLIRRKYTLLWFALIPVVNMLICVLLGCSPLHFIDTYLAQTGEYQEMTCNFPNLWILMDLGKTDLSAPAVVMAVSAAGYGLFRVMHRPSLMSDTDGRIRMMLWTIWTCLMFLPHMHDRYGYLLSVLLIVWITLERDAWIPALLLELATLFCYRYLLFFDLADDGMKAISFIPFALGWAWMTRQFFFRSDTAASSTSLR